MALIDASRDLRFGAGEERGQQKDPGASAGAIRHHYDVGNEFYALWLDPMMVYSAGMWSEEPAGETLEDAQIRKLDHHIREARATGAKRVLDVGCGWGALLHRLVTTHGVEGAVGLTLSREQALWIQALGDPRIETRVESWWDHQPAEPYDAIVSVEAFEHFARPEYTQEQKVQGYRAFFARCHRWLRPGGWMSVQMFGYATGFARERGLSPGCTSLFPETEAPALAEMIQALEKLFSVSLVRNDPLDLNLTARMWGEKLQRNRARATEIIGVERVGEYVEFLEHAMVDPHGDLALYRMTLRRCDGPHAEMLSRLLTALPAVSVR